MVKVRNDPLYIARERVCVSLRQAASDGRLHTKGVPKSYVVYGPKGSGKTRMINSDSE